MSTSEIFLVAMGIIFLVPYLIWRVGKTEYYAPLVVVQIITGILPSCSIPSSFSHSMASPGGQS